MRITLHLYGELRGALGSRETELEMPAGSTLGVLERLLLEMYDRNRFTNPLATSPLRALRALVNGEDVTILEGEQTMLKDGDIVTLIPPFAGG
jgi:molybdopterin converting factor small subunit